MRLLGQRFMFLAVSVAFAEGLRPMHVSSYLFHCADGKLQIASSSRCDAEIDCEDKSDERHCSYDLCDQDIEKSLVFKCNKTSRCILNTFRCDGQNDCSDGSDELNCTRPGDSCGEAFFRCSDGNACIDKWLRCDGRSDCSDGSDETACPQLRRGDLACLGHFNCGDGTCLTDNSFVCDGQKACANGFDESTTVCKPRNFISKCQHEGLTHSAGSFCTCRPGYELDADGFSCKNVNECDWGVCSHDCSDTEGSFTCTCRPGYRLENKVNCIATVPPVYIWYLANGNKNELVVEENATETKYDFSHLVDVDLTYWLYKPPMFVDWDEGKVYYIISEKLNVVDLNDDTLTPSLVLPPHIHMKQFALDPSTRNVYFTSGLKRNIMVCSHQLECMPLITARSPPITQLRVARTAKGTRLFWKEMHSRVMMCTLDGSSIETVFENPPYRMIRTFAVHELSNKLYAVDNDIIEIDLKTLTKRVLVELDLNSNPDFFWDMQVFDDFMTIQLLRLSNVTQLMSKQPAYEIHKFSRLDGTNLGEVHKVRELQLHEIKRKSIIRSVNPCWNHQCSHVCVPGTVTWYKCLCPPGMSIDESGSECLPLKDREEVFFVNGTVFSSHIFEDELLYHIEKLDLRVRPLAITSDVKNRLVYSTHRGIFLLTADGERIEVGSRLGSVHAMVFDPVDNVIYAAKGQELIMISMRNNQMALIGNDLNIAHLDIDIEQRVLFAETRDQVLYSMEIGVWKPIDLFDIRTPSQGNQKSWAFDPYDGNIREDAPVVLSNGYCDLDHDDALGFDCQKRTVYLNRCNHSEHDHTLLARTWSDISVKSACHESDCELCVTKNGTQKVCLCPYGHSPIVGGSGCSDECARPLLRCPSEKKCINPTLRCDGHQDCSDGADERDCDVHDCGSNFKCHNGICIDMKFKCDGQNDCLDGSDEADCPMRNCTAREFRCQDGTCLNENVRCNEREECFHGEDEWDCPPVSCTTQQFQCASKQCIPKKWVCDGNPDCADGHDESDCVLPSSQIIDKPRPSPKYMPCNPKVNVCCASGERLSLNFRCNGFADCEDGSDEKDCPQTDCKAPQFRCSDGRCLTNEEVCDGKPDCIDHADELNCRGKCAQKDLFECLDSGRCLPESKVCDENSDCEDGSDEALHRCAPVKKQYNSTCFAGEYKCSNGECISMTLVCDGKMHCSDESDEGSHCSLKECENNRGGCSQLCNGTPEGVRCGCVNGYRLMTDGFSCEDIDECSESPEVCSHFCTNLKGSYSCSCKSGFVMNGRGECRLERNADPILLMVEHGIVEVVERHNKNKIFQTAGTSPIGGIAYDLQNGLAFISETEADKIHTISLDKPETEHRTNLRIKPGAIAVDWITKNVYYADQLPFIHVCDGLMLGKHCTSVTTTSVLFENGTNIDGKVVSMALVPSEGIMFFSEHRSGFIFRMNMDGSNKTTFDWNFNERKPESLTIDFIHRRIYWLDRMRGSIASSDFYGKNTRHIVEHLGFVHTIGIFEDFVYYPDVNTEHWVSVHKTTGKKKSSKFSTLGRATSMLILHAMNQPIEDENFCAGHPCNQMCLLKPSGYSCACTYGSILAADNITCVESNVPETGLLVDAWERQLEAQCSCQNDGKCFVSKLDSRYLYCKCPPGFHGKHCEYGPSNELIFTVLGICVVFFVLGIAGFGMLMLAVKTQRRFSSQKNGDNARLIEEMDDVQSPQF